MNLIRAIATTLLCVSLVPNHASAQSNDEAWNRIPLKYAGNPQGSIALEKLKVGIGISDIGYDTTERRGVVRIRSITLKGAGIEKLASVVVAWRIVSDSDPAIVLSDGDSSEYTFHAIKGRVIQRTAKLDMDIPISHIDEPYRILLTVQRVRLIGECSAG